MMDGGETSETRVRMILIVGIALLVVSAVALIVSQPPWVDEAWFASPALSLLSGEGMRTAIIADTTYASRGFAQRTYWQPPGYFLLQAGWYSVTGFSLLAQRLLSLAGALAVVAVAWRLMRLAAITALGSALAVVLLATSPALMLGATSGRMDSLSAAFGLAGLLAYLASVDREDRSLLFAAHICVAASGLTHPNGIVFLATIIALTLAPPRAIPRLSTVSIVVAPYLVLGCAWGVYILQDPAVFRAQFMDNMQSYPANFPNVFAAMWREAASRYWHMYGVSLDRGWPRALASGAIKGSILVANLASLFLIGRAARRGQPVADRRLLILALGPVLGVALLTRNKSPMYLVYTAASFGIAMGACFDLAARAGRGRAALAIAGFIVAGQMVWSAHLVRVYRPKRADFNRLSACLASIPPAMPMYGSAELAYAVGFSPRFHDDATHLGTRDTSSHRTIVVSQRYTRLLEGVEAADPPRAAALRAGLDRLPVRYRFGDNTVYSTEATSVCADRQDSPASSALP